MIQFTRKYSNHKMKSFNEIATEDTLDYGAGQYRSSNSADKCCTWSNFGPEFAQPRSPTITRVQHKLSIKSAKSDKDSCQLAAVWLLLVVASLHLHGHLKFQSVFYIYHINAKMQPLRVAKL